MGLVAPIGPGWTAKSDPLGAKYAGQYRRGDTDMHCSRGPYDNSREALPNATAFMLLTRSGSRHQRGCPTVNNNFMYTQLNCTQLNCAHVLAPRCRKTILAVAMSVQACCFMPSFSMHPVVFPAAHAVIPTTLHIYIIVIALYYAANLCCTYFCCLFCHIVIQKTNQLAVLPKPCCPGDFRRCITQLLSSNLRMRCCNLLHYYICLLRNYDQRLRCGPPRCSSLCIHVLLLLSMHLYSSYSPFRCRCGPLLCGATLRWRHHLRSILLQSGPPLRSNSTSPGILLRCGIRHGRARHGLPRPSNVVLRCSPLLRYMLQGYGLPRHLNRTRLYAPHSALPAVALRMDLPLLRLLGPCACAPLIGGRRRASTPLPAYPTNSSAASRQLCFLSPRSRLLAGRARSNRRGPAGPRESDAGGGGSSRAQLLSAEGNDMAWTLLTADAGEQRRRSISAPSEDHAQPTQRQTSSSPPSIQTSTPLRADARGTDTADSSSKTRQSKLTTFASLSPPPMGSCPGTAAQAYEELAHMSLQPCTSQGPHITDSNAVDSSKTRTSERPTPAPPLLPTEISGIKTQNTRSAPAITWSSALHKTMLPDICDPGTPPPVQLARAGPAEAKLQNTRLAQDDPANPQGASLQVTTLSEFLGRIYRIFLHCIMPPTVCPTRFGPAAPKPKSARSTRGSTNNTPEVLAHLTATRDTTPPSSTPVFPPTWCGGAGNGHRSSPHSGSTMDLLAQLEATLVDVAGDGHCQYAAALASIAPTEWHQPLLSGSSIEEVAGAISGLRFKAEMALRRLFRDASTSSRIAAHLRNKWDATEAPNFGQNVSQTLLNRLSPPALANYKEGTSVPFKHWGNDETLHLIAQGLQTPIFCFPIDGAAHSGGMPHRPLAFLSEDSPLLLSARRRAAPPPRDPADHLDLYETVGSLHSQADALALLARAHACGLRPILLAYTGIHYQAIIPSNPQQRAQLPPNLSLPPLAPQPLPQQPPSQKPPPPQTKKPPPAPPEDVNPRPPPVTDTLPPQQPSVHPMSLRDRSLERAWEQIPESHPTIGGSGTTKAKTTPPATRLPPNATPDERLAANVTRQVAKQLKAQEHARRATEGIRSLSDDEDEAAPAPL